MAAVHREIGLIVERSINKDNVQDARRQAAGQYPANEMQAFADAITLARAGVIGYVRFVARISGPIPKATRSGSDSE